MEKMIVLLRGINVGGNRRMKMADLHEACIAAGVTDIQTYIQSGNLIFSAASPTVAETLIEGIVLKRFGFAVEAIARTAKQWATYAKGSPFAEPDERGNIVHLGLSKAKPAEGLAEALATRASHGETIVIQGDAIWIDFKDGVRDTRLSPSFIDKATGSTVTMRNWHTVQKLADMTRDQGLPAPSAAALSA